MATDPAERFNKIFANIAKPALPDPSQPHIADLELATPQLANSVVKRSSSDDEHGCVKVFIGSAKPEMLQKPKVSSSSSSTKPAIVTSGDANGTKVNLPRRLSDSSEDNISPTMRYPEDFETDTMQPLPKLPVNDVDGNKATGHFCVFSLVAKFPYKYMKDPSDKVSKRFFAYNKFYEREWDIYYIQPLDSLCSQPVILLPVEKVQQLLKEISSAFKVDVPLPPAPFTMSFFNDKTPQPVFLGRSKSRDEYNELITSVPAAGEGHGECPETASAQEKRAFKDFHSKFLDARAANKKGKTRKQEQKAKEKMVTVREGRSGLRRTQRYFGLRPGSEETAMPDESLSWEEQQKWRAAEKAQKDCLVLAPVDVTKPSPHPFENEVVFISFDVEANEHAHHLITEIGVSTLDTKDILNLPPGPGGENWIKQIRSRHFRIEEHKHMRNKTYVFGNPDGFEFGESEFVSLKTGEAVTAVDNCFMFPFSAGFQHDGTRKFKRAQHLEPVGPAERRIVLIGHDVQTDVDYLSKMGSKIFTPSLVKYPPVAAHPVMNSIQEALDVAILYKVLKNEANPRSLGSVMADLGRDAWSLHNGGNDARYTMECLIGLAIKSRLEDDVKAQAEAESKPRLAAEAEAATAAWVASDAAPNSKTSGEIDDAEDQAAANAKFLDPAQTPGSAINAPPAGKGRHYGSDNELEDDFGEEDEWSSHLASAGDGNLNLNGNNDDDDESEWEM